MDRQKTLVPPSSGGLLNNSMTDINLLLCLNLLLASQACPHTLAQKSKSLSHMALGCTWLLTAPREHRPGDT